MSGLTVAERAAISDLTPEHVSALAVMGIPVNRVTAVAAQAIRSTFITQPLDIRGGSPSTDSSGASTPISNRSYSPPVYKVPSTSTTSAAFSNLTNLNLDEQIHVAPSTVATSQISSSEQTWQRRESTKNRRNLKTTYAALESIHENETDPTRHRLMTMELVSKALAYSDIPLGEMVRIPMMRPKTDGSGEMESVMCICRVLVHDLGNGNLAYIFEPNVEGASPIIAFRGTCPSDLATVRSSCGVRALTGVLTGFWTNIGAQEVSSNKSDMVRILKYLRNKYPGVKPILTGHSLGGAIAQRFMVEDGVYEHVSKVVTFNSPTINRSATKKWNELVDAGELRDDQAETVSIETDRLVNHRQYSPISHLNAYFLGRKYRFSPEGMQVGKDHSGCVLSLGGHFSKKREV